MELTSPLETSTRKKIDLQLKNLGWNTDEESPKCNVYTERPKTKEQKAKLKGDEPDYVLYESETDTPIAIIETKRPDWSIKKALGQGIGYADKLGVKIVFATDGTLTETYHIKFERELQKDNLPISELLSEKELLRFIETGQVETPKEIQYTKKELIKVFERANELLRKDGLSEGKERFTEFANLLFMKMINEIEDDREKHGLERRFEKRYCWDYFQNYDGQRMLEYINDTILPKLIHKYNGSGDVFESAIKIKPRTLKEIVDKLSGLNLLSIDTDVKGDAFEYFLKESVSVGNDLGEYFTPRHIVKLMVKLVDPKFGDTIYDPCCGTGGFLIEAYKQIWNKCNHTKANIDKLQEETIYGRELTSTARIAKMNMILAGDGHTNITQIDSLENPVKDTFDVVLTNFPFAQETDYSSLYGFDTKDANPIFLKHIIEALKDDGRAGVVVFQGILYDNVSSYSKIRQILLETCNVEAVIKLHNFVFKPYAGANTSILILKKGKPTEKVWFFNVENDGFEKTGSLKGRPPIPENDLKTLIELWESKGNSDKSWLVDIETIKKNNWNLNAETYRPSNKKQNKSMIPILDVADLVKETIKSFEGNRNYLKTGDLDNDVITNVLPVSFDNRPSRANLNVQEGDVIFAKMKNTNKSLLINRDTKDLIVSTGFVVLRSKNKLNPEYLKYIVSSSKFLQEKDKMAHGSTQEAINEIDDLSKLKIPLVPLAEQNSIVSKLNKYKEIIDGINRLERTIFDGGIDDSFFQEGVETKLGEVVVETQYGTSKLADAKKENGIPILRMNNLTFDGELDLTDLKYIDLNKEEREKYLLQEGDLLFNRTNSQELVGKTSVFYMDGSYVFASYLIRIKIDEGKALPKYVSYFLNSKSAKRKLLDMGKPSVNMSNINAKEILSISFPLPSMTKQKEAIAVLDSQFEALNNLRRIRKNNQEIIDKTLTALWD